MAEYKKVYYTSFNQVYNFVSKRFPSLSSSTSVESTYRQDLENTSVGMIVLERFSYMGSNRVSLSVLMYGNESVCYLCMTSSGGSQALFFKINRIGENNFLGKAIKVLESEFKPNPPSSF